MFEFIYQLSSIQLFVFLNIVLFLTSLTVVSLVRRHIPLDFRYEENTAIVSCSALLGVIFAVLVGFTILYQFSSFDKDEKAEEQEGSTLYSIYQNAGVLPEPVSTQIRILALDYAKNAVYNEWPDLNIGKKIDPRGRQIISEIVKEARSIDPASLKSNALSAPNTIIQDTSILYKTHHTRISVVHTTLNGHIWFVLIIGTFFTLGINFLLGMEFRLHLFCLTLISIVLSSIIYLLVGLDRPYQGDFVVHPDTIAALLEENPQVGQSVTTNPH